MSVLTLRICFIYFRYPKIYTFLSICVLEIDYSRINAANDEFKTRNCGNDVRRTSEADKPQYIAFEMHLLLFDDSCAKLLASVYDKNVRKLCTLLYQTKVDDVHNKLDKLLGMTLYLGVYRCAMVFNRKICVSRCGVYLAQKRHNENGHR